MRTGSIGTRSGFIGSLARRLCGAGARAVVNEAATRSGTIRELNPLQLAAVNEYGVLNGENLLVSAPTTSGKTMIGELLRCGASLTAAARCFFCRSRRSSTTSNANSSGSMAHWACAPSGPPAKQTTSRLYFAGATTSLC